MSYVWIAQYDLQNKLPRFKKKIIMYYKNSNLIFMVI